MKSSLTAALIPLLIAGNALAADGFWIESEDQFARDYGDQIERMTPGVYQVVKGPLAGKTVTLGETGLAYDLAALRTQIPTSLRERAQIKARIKQLEGLQARYAARQTLLSRDLLAKKSATGSFPCYYRPFGGGTIFYYAVAQLNATTEYYLSDGGGGLNYYYARASATAVGNIYRTGGVPFGTSSVTAYSRAENKLTGQVVQKSTLGFVSTGVATGYVYSGPDFGHNLEAVAAVYGNGDCLGYAAISDALQ